MNSSTGTVIGVIGGGTGAGASVLVAGCAMRAQAAGLRVAALDADPDGGGLDIVFGIETEPGIRWEQLAGASGQLDGARLTERLPATESGVVVLSHGRLWRGVEASIFHAAVTALRECMDLLLVDVGRANSSDDVVQMCDGLVMIARGTAQGLAAAGATAGHLTRAVDGLVLRDAGRMDTTEIEEALGIPVVGGISTDRHVQTDLDRGLPPGGRRGDFATACDELLRDLLLDDAVAAA